MYFNYYFHTENQISTYEKFTLLLLLPAMLFAQEKRHLLHLNKQENTTPISLVKCMIC
jgi:hypothetical protein